ncbi:MAG: orotidine-5'-phosphate decarboxylase [Oscillospiraceae bacterium]|jgi:orotidine-5'-phosphate decarboxylase|nr:orotidine-5'-phosphate decarboxylase [Oscillospiraceae bacterium]
MPKDVIIPLDFSSAREVFGFLALFPQGEKPYVKIGMELFYSEGPEIAREIKRRGHRLFLDLKLHDIPNTAKKAAAALSRLGADIVNVHAAGTGEMMRAALGSLTRPDGTEGQGTSRPLVIAVTQLTSTSEERMREELLINAGMEETVLHYAKNAKAAGLDGEECSPLEAASVKAACGPAFLTVTPGIRFADSAADDQTRIMTPEKAREAGSDYIVVGRPIIAAGDPLGAYRRCVKEFFGA